MAKNSDQDSSSDQDLNSARDLSSAHNFEAVRVRTLFLSDVHLGARGARQVRCWIS
jgi:hypothetical protein